MSVTISEDSDHDLGGFQLFNQVCASRDGTKVLGRVVSALLVSIVLLSGCTRPDPVSAEDFSDPVTWGSATNVVGVKHLYLSAQPDSATLVKARDHGVGVVINLRGADELEWDEEGAVTDAGLTYYHVPVAGSGTSFDSDAMEKISTLVKQHNDQKVLLHCSSGNRAAAWLAIHMVDDHGMGVDTSISLAQKAGLTKPGIEARVRVYLNAGGDVKTN